MTTNDFKPQTIHGFAVIYRIGAMKLVKEFVGEKKWQAFDFAHWANGKVVFLDKKNDRHLCKK